MKRNCIVVLLVMVFSLAAAAAIPAGERPDGGSPEAATTIVPHLFNYQGVLRDAGGNPLSGSFDMVFRLYYAPTGGSVLYADTHDVAAPSGQVVVDGGLFTAQVGAGNKTGGSEPSLFAVFGFWDAVYLEVEVDGEVLSPRIQVVTSPFAVNAITLAGLIWPGYYGELYMGESGTGHGGYDVQIEYYGDTTMMLRTATHGGADAALKIMGSRDTNETANISSLDFLNDNNDSAFTGARIAMRNSDASPATPNADLVLFTNNGSSVTEKVRIQDDGKVGIGISAPSYLLDVAGDARVSGCFRDSSGDAGSSGQFLQSTGSGTEWADGSTGDDGDWTLSGSDMYSAVSGNVGIGTTSPDTDLHVYSGADLGGLTLQVSDNTFSQGIRFRNTATSYTWHMYRKDAGSNHADLIFANGADSDLSALTDAVTFEDGGNVGIGTNAPGTKLDVRGKVRGGMADGTEYTEIGHGGGNGYINTVGDGNLEFRHDNNACMSLTDAGKLGIGTTTPPEKLSIKGGALAILDAGDTAQVSATNTATGGYITTRNTGGSNLVLLGDTVDGAGAVNIYGTDGKVNIRMDNYPGVAKHGKLALRDAVGTDQCGLFVDASGNGVVWGDVKSFRCANPRDGATEIWYASVEGPEAAAYVRGTSRLEKGRASVPLPEHFQDVATLAGMTVQLTPSSERSLGLAVAEKRLDGFEVVELNEGGGNYGFDWEVKAVRKGYEGFEVIRPRMGLQIAPTAQIPARKPAASTVTTTSGSAPAAGTRKDEGPGPLSLVRESPPDAVSAPPAAGGPASAFLPAVADVEAGDILVMIPGNGDELYPCALAADPAVVGVAGEGTPEAEAGGVKEIPVVLAGITFCKVDAAYGPVRKGDLLAASPTPGHAMRMQAFAPGTVVGKALEPLESGTGVIRVLVMVR